MITFEEAQSRIGACFAPLGSETISLERAVDRVLFEDIIARRTVPPANVSAMDGYALRFSEVSQGEMLKVVGESAAGHPFTGELKKGQALRIFTGAILPQGADTVLIQENAQVNNNSVTIKIAPKNKGEFVRAKGLDFVQGHKVLSKNLRLNAQHIFLLAALNYPWLKVYRKPKVALLCTGSELVHPGEPVEEGQIISANGMGLKALLERAGAEVCYLGIAQDNPQALQQALLKTKAADLILTSGGASVGTHDLIAQHLDKLKLDFWKIKMRPGKPLVFGNYQGIPFLGLPGNPVSAMVCAKLFCTPVIRMMQGEQIKVNLESFGLSYAPLAHDLSANGTRKQFMRAILNKDGFISILGNQDSSLLVSLSMSNCLAIRDINAKPCKAGDFLSYIPL